MVLRLSLGESSLNLAKTSTFRCVDVSDDVVSGLAHYNPDRPRLGLMWTIQSALSHSLVTRHQSLHSTL